MAKVTRLFLAILAVLEVPVCAFVPSSAVVIPRPRPIAFRSAILATRNDEDIDSITATPLRSSLVPDSSSLSCQDGEGSPALVLLIPLLAATILTPQPAEAAGAVGSGLVAYAHYLSLLMCTGALVVERLTVKADMTAEEDSTLLYADTVYGIAAVITVVSGYLRVTEYGKGWEYYAHEPLFWFKMSLVGVWGALSFFPTLQILKRNFGNGLTPPMSEKLAARMQQVMNAELTALFSIPLAASFMARGVLYTDSFPWQAGAALSLLAFGGLGFKYANEALTWTEESEEE